MTARITFLPVGNGDMTLLQLGDVGNTTILIDCNIRAAADNPSDPTRDVASDLRRRLSRDALGRPYVNAFMLSHPDQDHCRGLVNHFYLGPPHLYPDDRRPDAQKRIFIREIWSSPIVFRRASSQHILCPDAKAFCVEARRRVLENRARGFQNISEGDQVVVLGEDEGGKTDDLGPILLPVNGRFSRINWAQNSCFSGYLLAPLPATGDAQERTKNDCSVVMQITLAPNPTELRYSYFLTGGDAGVEVWEDLWRLHRGNIGPLAYDVLQAPHHCSWHSLSHDSWSDLRDRAKISVNAKNALSQIRQRGFIVLSSSAVKDDNVDPPCIRARREYESIARGAGGIVACTGEYPGELNPAPLELDVGSSGVSIAVRSSTPPQSGSLLRPAAAAASGLTFPDKAIRPNKPAGYA